MYHLFLDLDNTIYSPRQIPFESVNPMYNFILGLIMNKKEKDNFYEDFISLSFPELLTNYEITIGQFKSAYEGHNLFKDHLSVKPYSDYEIIRELNQHNYLITTGFTDFQRQKIESLGIKKDFREIMIDDPIYNPIGKTLAFKKLIQKFEIDKNKIIVIGDNPESEIRSGKELNLKTIIIDRKCKYENKSIADEVFTTFIPLKSYLSGL